MKASTGGSGDFERKLPKEGPALARCYQILHIGTIDSEYQGKKTKKNIIQVSFELPTQKAVFNEDKGEQPFSVHSEFTYSMNEKANLRKFITQWRGKSFTDDEAEQFDISKLVGKPAVVGVEIRTSKSGTQYAVINSIQKPMEGQVVPAQINPSFVFDVDEFDKAKFESLAPWLQEKVQSTYEYKELLNSKPESQGEDIGEEGGIPSQVDAEW